MFKAIMLALLVSSSPAFAFDTSKLDQMGSLPLDDIMPLIGQSPKLEQEVAAALAKIGKKPDDINCDGMRFNGSWTHLGGGRASPYVCNIGDKWIQVCATVRLTGRGGKVYDKIDAAAMKNVRTMKETKPAWTWTDDDPHEKTTGWSRARRSCPAV